MPLPRQEGFELFLLQFSGHQIYFTPLIEYQTKKESARPQFIVTHYTDLVESNDIVLMVGEPAGDSSIKLTDAQTLLYCTQLFYVTGSKHQTDLVEKFWTSPNDFDYQHLIDAVANLS